MYNKPIKHVRMSTMNQLQAFSYSMNEQKAEPMTYCQNNGQIAFADQWGRVNVTPYRSETHAILQEAGYREGSIFVPFSNGEKRPEAYKWLAQIANEECWAETFENAYKIAQEKGIKPVNLKNKSQVREVTQVQFEDAENKTIYNGMIMQYLHNESSRNIGTYILLDEKSMMICDEYGRTFLIRAKTVINDSVNAIIEAGYTRTPHPERYINNYNI